MSGPNEQNSVAVGVREGYRTAPAPLLLTGPPLGEYVVVFPITKADANIEKYIGQQHCTHQSRYRPVCKDLSRSQRSHLPESQVLRCDVQRRLSGECEVGSRARER